VVFAEEVKVLTPESSMIIFAGKTNEIMIPIKNEGPEKDTVYISIWPTQWVSLEKYWITLEPEESKTISFFITPPEEIEEGTKVFQLTTQSLNTNKTTTKSLFLNVKRKNNVFISEIKINKNSVAPQEILEIESVLTNLHKTQTQKAFLETKILDSEGNLVERFEENVQLDPKTVKMIKNFYEVDKFQTPGSYNAEVELKDPLNKLLDREDIDFDVKENFEITKHKIKDYGLFYSTVSIEVTNEGNKQVSEYTVEESLPKITKYFFYPKIEPTTQGERENRVIYSWVIEDIAPGQTKIIKYNLRFINVFLIFLALSFVVLLVYEYITKPIIEKRYFGLLSGDKDLKITLNIKNKRKTSLKDVIVKDKVPPIAKVLRKFDTRTPEVKMKSSGTELIWKIDKIKPNEEIVLTYKIKPLIDVIGKMKLPKSYLTYKGKVSRNRRVVSKSVSITGKVK
jgi:hypothetical protein